jgi:hypothetical protein
LIWCEGTYREPRRGCLWSKQIGMTCRVESFISRGRVVLSLGLIALSATACARSAGPDSGGTSGLAAGRPGRQITVGPQDAGKTITLRVDETLVFSVSNGGPSNRATGWHLLSFPRNLISLTSRSRTPPFRFRALSPGVGELRLTAGHACSGPGPLAGSSKDCPVAESSEVGSSPSLPIRLLTFSLKVVPRGQ